MNEIEQKLIYILFECNQHKKMINASIGKIDKYLPLTIEKYRTFNTDHIGYIDQYLFRFLKIQDSMGEKLFVTILFLLGEDFSKKPFIDILNRFEKIGLIDKNEWLHLRKIRNNLAHEYGIHVEELVDSLNDILALKNKIIDIYDTFYDYCFEKFEFVKNSEELRLRSHV